MHTEAPGKKLLPQLAMQKIQANLTPQRLLNRTAFCKLHYFGQVSTTFKNASQNQRAIHLANSTFRQTARMMNVGRKCAALLKRGRASVRSMNETHYVHIRSEFNQVKGLIPLLMKHRNGGHWTIEERKILLRDLRALSNLSPYLIPILLPGGIFMLPLVAYLMDRRRNIRKNAEEQKQR